MRPRLVLLHGLMGAPCVWEAWRRAFEASGHIVEAPLLPGHGRRWEAPRESGFDDVVASMADRLGAGPLVLVGYSMGARVGLALGARLGERVRSVVAVGAHTGMSAGPEREARRAWELSQADDLEARGLAAFVEGWERMPLFSSQARVGESVLASQRAVRRSHTAAGIAWAFRALGTGSMPPLLPRLASAGTRVVFVAGAEDLAAARIGEAGARTLPGARSVIVPGAGHNVLLEAPDALAHVVQSVCDARASDGSLDRSIPLP